MWAIGSALYLAAKNKHSSRPTSYKFPTSFTDTFKNIEFPLQLKVIEKIEKKLKVSINVYSYDNKTNIYPLQITKTLTGEACEIIIYKR